MVMSDGDMVMVMVMMMTSDLSTAGDGPTIVKIPSDSTRHRTYQTYSGRIFLLILLKDNYLSIPRMIKMTPTRL